MSGTSPSLPAGATFHSINSVYISTLICYNNVRSDSRVRGRGQTVGILTFCHATITFKYFTHDFEIILKQDVVRLRPAAGHFD